jgi:hypothetical protein
MHVYIYGQKVVGIWDSWVDLSGVRSACGHLCGLGGVNTSIHCSVSIQVNMIHFELRTFVSICLRVAQVNMRDAERSCFLSSVRRSTYDLS